jgi:hypothetical protein
MTHNGKLVLTVYSLIVLVFLIAKDFKKGDKGWRAAFLVPIIILLSNI